MSTSKTRRTFLKKMGAALIYAFSLPGCKNINFSSNKPPNLIYVFADQLRYQSCGYAGDELAITPNIDRLAAQGINFFNAISTSPLCAPHRASLFTGQYPSTTGMVINELNIRPDHRCMAHVLSEAGYQTGYIGKWHLRALKNAPIPPGPPRLGFDGYWAVYNFNHRYYQAKYWLNDNVDEPFLIDGYEPDVQTDMAINFIKKTLKKKQPFALFLSYGPPHPPWKSDNTPQNYVNRFNEEDFHLPPNWSDTQDPYMDRKMSPERWLNEYKPNLSSYMKAYYGMTTNIDWNVGRLLKSLDQLGLSENTIFVFSSDHGEMFGAHGRFQKLTFYEEAARIPFLIRWPAKIPAGQVSDACLGTVDIMPTLLTLMNLEVPKSVEGMSLAHLALGKKGPEPEAAFMQGMGHTFQWKDGYEWRALRDKRFTYAIYRRDRSELLFDNVKDPYQMKNLVNDPNHRDILEHFRAMLKERMAELNDNFEVCTWYRDHWIKDRTILRGTKG